MKIKISPTFYIIWIIFLLLGRTDTVITVFICGVLHEAGHICAYSVLGLSRADVTINACGISADFKGRTAISYKNEIICFLAGGMANLLTAPVFFLISRYLPYTNGGASLFLCSIVFGILNLLPIYPLDGGRVLFSLLAQKFPLYKAKRITNVLGIIFLIPITALAFYALFITKFNVSLLLICAYLFVYILSGR